MAGACIGAMTYAEHRVITGIVSVAALVAVVVYLICVRGPLSGFPSASPSSSMLDPVASAAVESEVAISGDSGGAPSHKQSDSMCTGGTLAAPANPKFANAVQAAGSRPGVRTSAAWFDPSIGIRTAGEQGLWTAWSTAKVPLSLTVIGSGDGQTYGSSISSALRRSDNEAADTLWRSLGPDDLVRGRELSKIFRSIGDEETTVPQTRLNGSFSVFGQTSLTPGNQVKFLLAMPCMTGADQVIGDMSAIDPSQRWGMGSLRAAVFKGGWGPDKGAYSVRQLGWYTDSSGNRVVIALSVQAESFDSGIAVLNSLVGQLG